VSFTLKFTEMINFETPFMSIVCAEDCNKIVRLCSNRRTNMEHSILGLSSRLNSPKILISKLNNVNHFLRLCSFRRAKLYNTELWRLEGCFTIKFPDNINFGAQCFICFEYCKKSSGVQFVEQIYSIFLSANLILKFENMKMETKLE